MSGEPAPEALRFPMRVGQFLDHSEDYLQPGDIVLSRSRTLASWLIRRATASPFSHSAVVFLLPRREQQLNNAFLLEATSAGVGIANLRSYVLGKRRSQIAIKRYGGAPAGSDFHKQVGAIMLDRVNAGYDFGVVLRIGLSVLFGLELGWSKLSRGSNKSMQAAVERTKNRLLRWIPPQFICAGFVQYGFLQAQLRRGGEPRDVIFRDDVGVTDKQKLLAITPEDMAQSGRLQWVYVIRNGWVHEAASYAEARRVMNSAPL